MIMVTYEQLVLVLVGIVLGYFFKDMVNLAISKLKSLLSRILK